MALFMAQLVFVAISAETFRNDFRLYVGGALVGLRHGFSRIYDVELQRQAVEGLAGGGNYQPFVSPPIAAWLAVPFAGVPFHTGVLLWTALLVAALVATWWLLAPGRGAEKLAHLVLAAGFLPLAFAVSVGQLAPLIGLSVAAGFVLLRRGRPAMAGVVMVLVWLKPQDALLVVPGLLVAGRVRCFVAWLAASALLGVVTVLSLGPEGITAYIRVLRLAGQWDLMRRFALPGQPFWGPLGPAVSLVPVIVTLAVARLRRHHLGLVMAAGLSGSLLVGPYLGLQDLYLLLPAAWLAWREEAPAWHIALGAVVYAVLELCLVLSPLPVLVSEVTWLLSLHFLGREQPGTDLAESIPMPGTGQVPPLPAPRPGAPVKG
jgi:hypothetical protein